MSDSNGNEKRQAALWIGVVFLLGASVGGILGYLFAGRSHADTRVMLSDDARRVQKVEKLTRELSLSPDQQKQLDTVIRNAQIQFKAIRESSQPQIDATRQKARDQVRAFLTPDQKPKYEEYLRQLDEEHKRNGQP
jgi:hypothetical protein